MATEKKPVVEAEEVKKEPSLRDIINDKQNSRDFSKWLEGQGKSELAARMITRKMESNENKDDVKDLAEQRREFLKRKTEAGEMKAILGSKEVLESFTQEFTEIRRIWELAGDDGMKEAIETIVDKTALDANDDHAKFYKSFTAWRDATIKVGEAKKTVDELIKGTDLTLEEAKKVSKIEDAAEREEAIKELLEGKGKGPSGEEGIWIWKKKVWTKEQQEMVNMSADKFSVERLDGEDMSGAEKIAELDKMIAVCNEQRKGLKHELDSMLSIRGVSELNRIIVSEKKEPDTTMGFQEMRQAVAKATDREQFEQEFFAEANESFAEFISANDFDFSEPEMPEYVKSEFFDKYLAGGQRGEEKGRGGIWAAVYKAVVKPFVEEFMPEFIKEVEVDKKSKKLIAKKKK